MTILPTHSCFDDALEYLNALIMEGDLERAERLRVVHGICLAPEGPLAGSPFAHGWIEEDGVCVQAGIVEGCGHKVYFGVDRAEFYASLRVQVTTAYSAQDAMRQNVRTGHFGPWEPSYRAIITQGDRTVFQ